MREELSTIQLTKLQANQFIVFQKHYTLINLLESINAFNLKNGSITINFNHLGQIKSINKHENFTL